MIKISEHENLTTKFVHSSLNLECLFGTTQTAHSKNGIVFSKHIFISPMPKTQPKNIMITLCIHLVRFWAGSEIEGEGNV